MTSGPGSTGLAARAAGALTSYREGDPAAMSQLVEELTPMLWHIARQQGLDTAAAEDVVQTAWLRLVESAERIDEPSAVLKWLITTTKREAWRLARTSRRALPTDELEEPAAVDPSVDPSEQVIRAQMGDIVWTHFRQLSTRCRELLATIAFTERPDYATLSVALGMPVGSIGPTRGRCLGKLRNLLEADSAWEARR